MRRAPALALAALLAALALAPAARAAGVSDEEELTRFGGEGAAAGRLDLPYGIATDPIDGHVYVVGLGSTNNRVDEFTPWGGFVKAFGWDVAPGAVNEQQEVRVRAASGAFRLEFEGHPSASLPLGATAPELESALGALPGLGAGAVHVEAVPGSADGKSPYIYVVAFRGSRAATNVPQLATVNEGLTGGQPSTVLEASTRAEGHAATAGLESCTEESGCQAGLEGGGAGELKDARAIAVDPAGEVFVREAGNDRVQKFDSAGRFLLAFGGKVDKTKVEAAAPEAQQNRCTAASGDVCQAGAPGTGQGQFSNGANASSGISLGPPGEIFVGDNERFQRFDLEGEYEAQAPLPGKRVVGLAFDPVSGDLYATFNSEGGVHKLDPATGAQLAQLVGQNAVATDAAGDLFAEEANAANRRSVFEYGPGGSPLSPASCCESPLFPPSSGGGQFNLTGIATNAIGDLYVAYFFSSVDSFVRSFGPGPVGFERQPAVPPQIVSQFASSVQTDGATVAARINPHFWPDARYYVQYGTGKCSEGGCEEEKPLPPGTLLTEKQTGQAQKATVSLEGLAPGTVYHYRFLAKSGGGGPVFGLGGGAPEGSGFREVGSESSFTTFEPLSSPPCPNDSFRNGPGSHLPDCRAYEMVSPAEKEGAEVGARLGADGYPAGLGQSASSGQKLTYTSYRAGPAAIEQEIASRDPKAGWQSEALNAPPGTASATPYRLFSEDLCQGWLATAAQPPLAPGAPAGYEELYRREGCGKEAYETLLAATPTVEAEKFAPELQGASSNGHAAIVRVKDKLTANAAAGPWQAYYSSEGALHLLCVLPTGAAATGNCSGGSGSEAGSILPPSSLHRLASLGGALSADGSKAYWTESGERASGAGKVYLRLNPGAPESATKEKKGNCVPEAGKACTVAISSAKTTAPSAFLAASPSGEKALFRVAEGPIAGNLYLFTLASTSSVKLAGKTLGVAGRSEDLSRIYFVSEEVLAGTTGATEGKPNLYLDNEGTMSFIATLSPADVAPESISDTSPEPVLHAARASADGKSLAFLSSARLTGYDNADQESGRPDAELFLYRVGSAGPVCVSCSPAGASPAGRVLSGPGGAGELPSAASIPLPATDLYAPRALSTDGKRLFFNSYDALLPRDTNGKEDVYEWESAASKTACEEKGAEAYVASAGGCLGLLSSGEGSEDAEFLDADPSGENVFFTTDQGLVGTDEGEEADIYDARVNGGFSSGSKPKFKLTVTKPGTGSGTVTSTPAGINCGSGAGCEAEFEEGTEVTLNQAAASGSEFKEWTGACTGSGACKVTMSAAKSVGAVFSPILRTLSIAKAGTGTGEVKCKFNGGSAGACTSPQPNGTAVEVLATANAGSSFAGFSAGTGSASSCSASPCSFTLEANSSLTATFNLVVKPKFKLTVSKSGTGSGTVTSTPSGINCGSGAGCEAEFEEGTEVTLNQAAASGSEFKEWTGACTGSGACKVTMSAAKSVGAVFSPILRTLSIAKAGTGTGEVKCKFNGGSAGACTSPQPNGTAVEVLATANAGSSFAGYSSGTGSASSCSTSPCAFTLEANSAVTATFNLTAKPKFKLSVTKPGTGSGTVSSTPAGINCGSGAGCEAEFEEGTEVTLNQSASTGSEFKEWTGACSGSGACKVTMSAAKSVGAVFSPILRTLSIAKAGTGTGEVKCKFNGGSAGACTSPQPNGTAVEVIATANAGSTFAGYSSGTGSASSCSTSPCAFTLEANSAVTATFNLTAKPKFKLSVTKPGTGSGTVTSTPAGINCGSGAGCEAEFEEGVEVTLAQAAASGSEFKEWTGACSGSGTCKVAMSAAKSVGAVFNPIPRTLSIAKTGTGTGEVKCKFNGGTAGACTSPQPNGTAVEVIATANAGSTFAGYSSGTGSASSCSTSPCAFTLEANSAVTATFNLTAKPKFKLSVTKPGTGSGTVSSTPAGINCGSGAGCEAEFEEGVEVTLNQAAASGSEFKEWTGACTGSGACKVTMSAAKSVGAVFSPIPRTLSITKTGTGTGEVKCKFNGGSAGACTSPQPNGTAVEVIATANPGSTFAGFSAGTGSAAACSTSPCSFTLEANSSVTATFNVVVKPKFKLTLSKSGTGAGTVTSTPAGINCGSGAGCEAEFEEGTEVTLNQSPAAGSEFKEWTGACSGSGACKVTMSAAKSVGAVFNLKPKPKFKLGVAKAGTGSGTITSTPAGINCGSSCVAEFEEGTEVTLNQAASPGSEFKEWSGACSGSGTCKVTMSSAKNVGARFNPAAKPKFKLSVSKTGTGTGTITSSPAGIICGAACEHEYEEGTHVTLTESPGAGSEFAGWQTPQCDESTATTCEVVIDGDEALAASFVPQSKPKPEFTLTVEISGNGSGLITCNDTACAASYPEGEKVSFAAVPLAGSSFSGWSGGGCSGTGACKVTIEEDTTIIAKFSSKPIVTPPPPLEKGTAIASGIAQVQDESALIRLLCPGSSRCTGTLELFARLQDPRSFGHRRSHRDAPKATLIGTASFDLAPRSQGTVSVKITSARALRLLGRGGDLDAQLLGTSVRARSVRLVGARVRHRRG